MPIRENTDFFGRIYRDFRFGDLVDLIMLDTRLEGRDKQPEGVIDRNDPNRTLLGWDQEEWLYNKLSVSQQDGTRWRVLGQQVMMAPMGSNEVPFNKDQWDGYPKARKRLYDHLGDHDIDNFVVLTGDIHSSWANDLPTNPLLIWEYNPHTGAGSKGVEFITPGVTSPMIDDGTLADIVSGVFNGIFPATKWTDVEHRGYVLLDITHERTQAEWYHMDTITERNSNESLAKTFITRDGQNHLEAGGPQTTGKADAPELAPAFKPVI